jgi:hypothetical protein
MFPIAQKYVRESLLVTDDQIVKSQKKLWKRYESPPNRAVRQPLRHSFPAATNPSLASVSVSLFAAETLI